MPTITAPRPPEALHVGSLLVTPYLHPQGCRTYIISDPKSKQALALDVHLDLVNEVAQYVADNNLTLPYVVDSHTHADHPSGAGHLAERFGSTRIAHEKAQHEGVVRHPHDGETLHLGDQVVTVRHAPGHTPDHMVLQTDGALFSGDSLLIGSVARTDFLGGDAGELFDSIHRIVNDLSDDVVLYPGHDYENRASSTIGAEKAKNPWLQMDRQAFVDAITANPPKRPANMDDLLRLNRKGVDIPKTISVGETIERIADGGVTSVIDVRTGAEYMAEHIEGSRHIQLDQILERVDEILATPAPRLLICRTDSRARMAAEALAPLGVSGLTVIEGGIEAFVAAGGDLKEGKGAISIERQVRIGAGLMGLMGTLLGAFVHPGFLVIPAFVGVGMTFAGLTDWCGMGLLLAKAPWNQADTAALQATAAGGCSAVAPTAGGCAASAPTAGGCAATPPKS